MALRDVMQRAVEQQREITAPKPLRGSGRAVALSILLLLLAGLCAYSWIERPEFIWGPNPKNVPPARQEANLRVAMYLLAQRVATYRAQTGYLPESLAPIGDSIDGVSYHVVHDTVFELRGLAAGKAVTLRSDQSLDAFLGNSFQIIQGHQP